MALNNILYFRKSSAAKFAQEKENISILEDKDMKKTINDATRPIANLCSNGIVRLLGFALLIFIYVTLAITFYQQYENWTITDAIFFVAQTLSTIGYGYPAPTNDNSRLFTIFFILIGIFVVFAGVQDFLYTNIGILRKYFCSNAKKQIHEDLAAGDIYHFRKILVRLIFGLLVTVVLGSVVLKFNENMTWITAFYFIIETAATVGYGDIVLVHASSKQFTVAFIIVSTTLVALTIRTFSATLQEDRQLDILENRLRRIQALRFNKNIPVSSGDNVSKSEIILAMLCRSGVLNHATDIAPWIQKIDAIDSAKRGTLTQDELNVLLDKEADDATKNLDNLMRAKSFSVWTTIREMFSPPSFIDLSAHATETYIDLEGRADRETGQLVVEMKDRTSNTGRHRNDRIPEDDVASPLARASE